MTDKLILSLMDKFNAGSLAELDINDGTTHITLKKESTASGKGLSPNQTAVLLGLAGNIADRMAGGMQNGSTFIGDNRGTVHIEPATKAEIITSPIVATFFASPGPDAPPFISPGSRVKAGDTLCILEAMKMMNNLEAEFDCEILTIEAGRGELVEYGQTLFTVKRLSGSES
ncbi:MAG: acetyl-CoA carboxylase biotin carboxyl carrier protein subunit [Treponema sp.]|jgi:acetyl-CoA carboxylase biotin carboxyl carrier protein|nr:acetyl-CoA carboxylase biotin carboxyl carrier protein subunit [Treponema sp.]